MAKINICDIIIVLILFTFMIGAYKKGMIRSIFGLCKTIVSIVLAGQAYPYITRFLRETGGLYDIINNAINSWLHFGGGESNLGGISTLPAEALEAAASGSLQSQVDLINSLTLPKFLKDSLITGNNSVIYEALNAEGIYDYISGFLTNICINIIGWILAFVIISLLLSLLANALDLIAKLPLIRTFNKLGGLVIGFLQAMIFIWICHVIIVLFFSSPKFAELTLMLQESMFAGLFFEYNLILELINKFVL